MTAVDKVIVTAFEVENISPEEISEMEEIDLSVVKQILLQHSPSYRASLRDINGVTISGSDESNGITKQEYEDILAGVKNMALYGDNEFSRLRSSLFLLDEYKGRNDARVRQNNQVRPINLKVGALILNQHLQKAKAFKESKKERLLEMETVG
jgi:hypothetical protein